MPTSLRPSSVNATIEGVVRIPSEFSITFGVWFSIKDTHELVVPRSMPIIVFDMEDVEKRRSGRVGRKEGINL
mgnify:CR=1 FL=1